MELSSLSNINMYMYVEHFSPSIYFVVLVIVLLNWAFLCFQLVLATNLIKQFCRLLSEIELVQKTRAFFRGLMKGNDK